jgi:hypothetical protein
MGTDDLFKKKRQGRKKRKVENREMRSRQWLIVSEGTKTEPNYIRGLIAHLAKEEDGFRDLSSFVMIEGSGRNTVGVVRSAEKFFGFVDAAYGKMLVPFGNIAVLFDKDAFGKDDFNHAIALAGAQHKQYTEIERYIPAWSNESFELWIYLHFEYTDSALGRQELNKKLTEIFRKGNILTGKQSYDRHMKSRETIFADILRCGGDVVSAIKHAKQLRKQHGSDKKYADQNPRTEVDRLVEALMEDARIARNSG